MNFAFFLVKLISRWQTKLQDEHAWLRCCGLSSVPILRRTQPAYNWTCLVFTNTRTPGSPCDSWAVCTAGEQGGWGGGNITRLTRIHKPSTKKGSVNLRAPSRRLSTARKYNTLILLLESDEIFTLSFTGNFFFSYPFLLTTCVANCLIWCCSFTCTCLWFLRWMELQWKGFNSTEMILLGFRIICFPSVIRRLTLSLLTDWLSFMRYEACITDHRRVTTIFLWL